MRWECLKNKIRGLKKLSITFNWDSWSQCLFYLHEKRNGERVLWVTVMHPGTFFSDCFVSVSRKLFFTSFTALEPMSIGVKDRRQCLHTWDCKYRNIWAALWMQLIFLKAKRNHSLSEASAALETSLSLWNQSSQSHFENWLLVSFISTWKHFLYLFIPKADLVLQASG